MGTALCAQHDSRLRQAGKLIVLIRAISKWMTGLRQAGKLIVLIRAISKWSLQTKNVTAALADQSQNWEHDKGTKTLQMNVKA